MQSDLEKPSELLKGIEKTSMAQNLNMCSAFTYECSELYLSILILKSLKLEKGVNTGSILQVKSNKLPEGYKIKSIYTYIYVLIL